MKTIRNKPILMIGKNVNGYQITKKITKEVIDQMHLKPIIDFETMGKDAIRCCCPSEVPIGHISKIVEVGEVFVFADIVVYDDYITDLEFKTHMIEPIGILLDKKIKDFKLIGTYMVPKY